MLTSLALAGCGAALGGSGMTKSGSPLVGEAIREAGATSTKYYVRDAKGMECYALLADSTDLFPKPTMNRTVPLHCKDGRPGTALLSLNQPKMTITMIYSIKGGEEGSVTFPMVR